MGNHKLLIVVDVQKDFCEGGALAVDGGNDTVPVTNRYIEHFSKDPQNEVVFTRDWHPTNHSSFAAQGGPWPPHCVQKTEGAGFHTKLSVIGTIFSKGQKPELEEYSACANDKTPLGTYIRGFMPTEIFVCGLATDYCVKQHVLDLRQNFPTIPVTVLTDAIAAVNVKPGDGDKALEEMKAAGAKLALFGEVISGAVPA